MLLQLYQTDVLALLLHQNSQSLWNRICNSICTTVQHISQKNVDDMTKERLQHQNKAETCKLVVLTKALHVVQPS